MSLLAHVVHDEETVLDKIVHPLTGVDHLLVIALVAIAGTLAVLAWRGRDAVDTEGGTTRVRSVALFTGSLVALAASIVLLVTV